LGVEERVKLGAVAILDALGVKGIWKREKPEAILGKLHALRSVVTGDLSKAQQAFPKMLGAEAITRQAAFLSDSLVVGVSIEPGRAEFLGNGPPVRDGFTDLVRQEHALRDLLFTLARLLNVAAADAPRLAYRGTVACGEFEFDDVFVLGPAIDEAAECASVADGAFVWLAPSANWALKLFGSLHSYMPFFDALAPPYAVPMKGGGAVSTRALNPFAEHEPDARESLLSHFMGMFSSTSDDVKRKQANTEAFLRKFLKAPTTRAVFEQLMGHWR
jgi:hypothetical protein